ncbi:hypothetical protein HED60_14165 [Planctomycetales bacterium ZRK34]|nr:hypothetical protein HED60_14165 [Planctomycetales bacterium ZRK34]
MNALHNPSEADIIAAWREKRRLSQRAHRAIVVYIVMVFVLAICIGVITHLLPWLYTWICVGAFAAFVILLLWLDARARPDRNWKCPVCNRRPWTGIGKVSLTECTHCGCKMPKTILDEESVDSLERLVDLKKKV